MFVSPAPLPKNSEAVTLEVVKMPLAAVTVRLEVMVCAALVCMTVAGSE
jgi:hypothetical protein